MKNMFIKYGKQLIEFFCLSIKNLFLINSWITNTYFLPDDKRIPSSKIEKMKRVNFLILYFVLKWK
jgi:hypothetical protein